MMELFKSRLAEKYQVLYSGIGGPTTLIYELEFESENGRKTDFTDAREDRCIVQMVMFPPITSSQHESTNQNSKNGIPVLTSYQLGKGFKKVCYRSESNLRPLELPS